MTPGTSPLDEMEEDGAPARTASATGPDTMATGPEGHRSPAATGAGGRITIRPSRPATMLGAYRRPPVGRWPFWLVQIGVVAIFAVQELADHASSKSHPAVPVFMIVVAYAVPVLYSAMRIGFLGTVITAASTTACVGTVMAQNLVAGRTVEAWAQNAQLVILDVVSVIVGHFAEVAQASRNEATSYAARVVVSEEEERRRIARELHDEPVQLLVHLSRILESLDVDASGSRGEPTALSEARSLASNISSSLRDISQGLRPPILEDLGLDSAVNRLVRDMRRRSDLDVSYSTAGSESHVADEVELAFYRIAQEALSNAERHSRAKKVQVTLTFAPGTIELVVSDDGVGPLGADRFSDGFGLVGMRERIRAVGGSLVVTSDRSSGTRLVARAGIGGRDASL